MNASDDYEADEQIAFDAEISDLPTRRDIHPGREPLWSARRTPFSARQRASRATSIGVALILAFSAILLSTRLNPTTLPTPSPSPPDANIYPTPSGPDILGYGEHICLKDAAWSPDSRRIAVLVEHATCTFDNYQPGAVRLFDVARQRTTVQYELDAPIFAALGVAPPTTPAPTPSAPSLTPQLWQTPTIFHQSVFWSRDGGQLAVAFLVILTFDPVEVGVAGLALLSLNGDERILLGPRDLAPTGAPTEWDLALGGPSGVNYPQPSFNAVFGAINLPPAFNYLWLPDGTLAPQPQNATITGAPIGDTSFSIWRHGRLHLGSPPANGATPSPPLYLYETQFAAWSPDGRYIIPDASIGVRLQPSDHAPPTRSALEALQVADLPVAAPPMPCLQSAINAVTISGVSTYEISVNIAWRPDQQVLAISRYGYDLTLFDCTSGRKLATARSQWPSDNALGLSWSPDGQSLLLPDGAILPAPQQGN